MGRSRPDRFDLAVAVVAAAAAALILWLGRGLTFFGDEWEFIQARALGDPSTWFVPHGEHWSTLPVLLYRSLIETVGLRSYVPYHAVLVALHLVVVAGAYVLIRRRSGPAPALVAAAIVAFLGSGYENLFWAFQMGFLGSTALCLAALIVLDGPATPRRAAALLVVLLCALATTAVGLVAVVIAAVEMLFTPRWRGYAWIVTVAAAVFAAWFVVIGRIGLAEAGSSLTVEGLLNVPGTIGDGLTGAAGGLLGLGPPVGAIAMVVLVALVGRGAARRELSPRVIAVIAGLLALFVTVAFARTERPEGGAPRFVYFAGVMLLVGISALVGRPRWPASAASVAASRGAPRAALAVAALLIVVSLAGNTVRLVNGASLFARRADITRAVISLALAPPPGRSFDRSKPLVITPSAEILERIVASYGSPVADALVPVPPVSADARAKAEAYLFGSGPIPVP